MRNAITVMGIIILSSSLLIVAARVVVLLLHNNRDGLHEGAHSDGLLFIMYSYFLH